MKKRSGVRQNCDAKGCGEAKKMRLELIRKASIGLERGCAIGEEERLGMLELSLGTENLSWRLWRKKKKKKGRF